jgi:hypothetical protein
MITLALPSDSLHVSTFLEWGRMTDEVHKPQPRKQKKSEEDEETGDKGRINERRRASLPLL